MLEILGVPKKDVDVTISENGEVTYVISNDSVEDATGVQQQLNDPGTLEDLNRRVDEAFPGTTVNDMDVADEIEADVDVTVDTTDATNDSTGAGDSITDSQGNNGWDVNTNGILLFLNFEKTNTNVFFFTEFCVRVFMFFDFVN